MVNTEKTYKAKSNLGLIVLILFLSLTWQKAFTSSAENKWLVIFSGSKTLEEAEKIQSQFDFETIITISGEYDNLNPGWYITCHPYESKAKALQYSSMYKELGYENYVKYSGNYTAYEKYLPENHFIVYGDEYLILDVELSNNDLSEILGYAANDGMTYTARAKVKPESIPDHVKYLKGKVFQLYNMYGRTGKGHVTGFEAVNISVPYWGFLQQWNEAGLSEIEISKNLFELGEPMLVARIEVDNQQSALIAHLDCDKQFLEFEELVSEDARSKVLAQYHLTTESREHVKSLHESMKTDEEYAHYSEELIDTVIQCYRVNGREYAFLNIVYGDYCDNMKYGPYYANMFAFWDGENFEILKDIETSARCDFFPLFLESEMGVIPGFGKVNYGGTTTFFRFSGWESYKSLGIWMHECD